jgi:predicted amino acid-binding ACT domain protein
VTGNWDLGAGGLQRHPYAHSVRVLGHDRPGIATELTQRLADAGINLRGFSASVIGTQFVAYVAVDSMQDANQAIQILKLG